jgi:glycogen synthase
MERAIQTFQDKDAMSGLIANALSQHNSWNNRIPEYERLYADAIAAALQTARALAARQR